jgi:hypothetical protein
MPVVLGREVVAMSGALRNSSRTPKLVVDHWKEVQEVGEAFAQ